MIILVFLGVFMWLLCGYIAFLIEARQEKNVIFNHNCKMELIASMFLGVVSIFIVTSPFKGFIEWTMRLVNRRKL